MAHHVLGLIVRNERMNDQLANEPRGDSRKQPGSECQAAQAGRL